MKKIFPRFLLFVSLLSLVSCTITKRKYTGGFYVNWHKKALETRVIVQEKTTRPTPIEVAHATTSPEKTVVEQKTEKTVNPQLVKDFKATPKEIGLSKNMSHYSSVSIHNLMPDDTTQQYTIKPPLHHTPRGLPVLFGFLSILGSIICLIIALLSFGNPPSATILIPIIITLVLIFLTFFAAVRILHEVKENPKTKGHGWAYFGIVLALIAILFASLIFA